MKVIIEKIQGTVYAYVETERHYKRVQATGQRTSQRFNQKDLDNECNLDHYPDNCYFVLKVKNVK